MMNLFPATKALWGKKAVHDDQEFWLPLVVHLIDTKNVMQWLYNNWDFIMILVRPRQLFNINSPVQGIKIWMRI